MGEKSREETYTQVQAAVERSWGYRRRNEEGEDELIKYGGGHTGHGK